MQTGTESVMSTNGKAIVVGSGIAGLTAAIALKRTGVDVEIFERTPRRRIAPGAVVLWPNALKALRQLGLDEATAALGFVNPSMEVRRLSGTVLSRVLSEDMVREFGAAPAVFHQAELLHALREAAQGIPIHACHRWLRISQDAYGVAVDYGRRPPVTGDVLVGADGLRSSVRASLGLPVAPRYAGYGAWHAVVSFDTARIVAGETLGRGHRFGLVPMSGNRVYWYATMNVPEHAHASTGDERQALLEVFRSWHDPIPQLLRRTDTASIRYRAVYDRVPDGRWGLGRTTLLGDAAHPMTPSLGLGASQAIEDALVLARCLADGRSAEQSLRRYEIERMERTGPLVDLSRRVGQIGQLRVPAFCVLRDLALRATRTSTTLRRLGPVIGYEGHLHKAFVHAAPEAQLTFRDTIRQTYDVNEDGEVGPFSTSRPHRLTLS